MSDDVSANRSKAKKFSNGAKKLIKNRAFQAVLVIVLLVGGGYALYKTGEHNGAERQKVQDTKLLSGASRLRNNQNQLASTQRKSAIGTVVNISDKQIEVKPKTGDAVKFAIDKNTVITGSDAKKVEVSALKKDQTVIVSGTVQKDKSFLAQRIRIQK